MKIPEPTEITLKLMSNEIENLIDELGRVQQDIYEFMNYGQLRDKLRNSLSTKKGCGKYETRGAYTFTCGSSTRKGEIQLCKECQKSTKEKGCGYSFCRDCGSQDIKEGHEESCTEGNLGIVNCGDIDLEEDIIYLCDKCKKEIKGGCGKKMDALGYIICGKFDDLKSGGKQWLCDACKSTKQVCDCGHIIDSHIEQVNGKAIAGECFECGCNGYLSLIEEEEKKE